MPTELTVVVGGESFLLLEDQITFDAPNLFTKFIDEHSENPQLPMRLSRNPQLFSVILEYLCGYTILPLRREVLPPGMHYGMALDNLRVDARYYGLGNLVKLLDENRQTTVEAPNPPEPAPTAIDPYAAPIFRFPGRVSGFSAGGTYRWTNHPLAFMEFPLQIDLMKSFTITCWYRATSNKGWHTMISLDVPSAPHPLLYISISPEGDWRFEIGIHRDKTHSFPGSNYTDSDRLASGSSHTPVQLRVWTHLTYFQQVEENGVVTKRALLLNGKPLVSSNADIHMYNPDPSKTQMALLRGSWDKRRTAGYLGQIENIAVFQRVLGQDEISAQAENSNMPAEHGLPGDRWDNVY
ncbi:unnamed protein product [Rhizoctonia solani]|uniref:BTB domain-containing protein n=1 Tax=Rhizoctonia solani TaxID=456999 RepID=A0A8H3BDQ4_9AGAM|nr:unnamed protein product [Rhizoctonia solani]